MFVLTATDQDGWKVYYTGRASTAWVSKNKGEAFLMGQGETEHTAAKFNERTLLHKLTFRVEPE